MGGQLELHSSGSEFWRSVVRHSRAKPHTRRPPRSNARLETQRIIIFEDLACRERLQMRTVASHYLNHSRDRSSSRPECGAGAAIACTEGTGKLEEVEGRSGRPAHSTSWMPLVEFSCLWFESMEPSYLAVALLVLGLTLIVCEVFIPSAGLIAAFATLCFAGVGRRRVQAWWYDKPGLFRDLRHRTAGLDPVRLERCAVCLAANRIRQTSPAGSARPRRGHSLSGGTAATAAARRDRSARR